MPDMRPPHALSAQRDARLGATRGFHHELLTEAPADLPGAELVAAGVQALRRGERTVEALLVAVGARRLLAAGLDLPALPELRESPELALYAAIGRAHPRDAHARYNSLVRRLVSFEQALERDSRRRKSGARDSAAAVR